MRDVSNYGILLTIIKTIRDKHIRILIHKYDKKINT